MEDLGAVLLDGLHFNQMRGKLPGLLPETTGVYFTYTSINRHILYVSNTQLNHSLTQDSTIVISYFSFLSLSPALPAHPL